ncbi:MAG: glycosyltransferase [Chloroflexota bacterium]
MPPKVSVVIPTYNSGHTITEAVDSALAQTVRDVEIIVVDDGSTDNTRERLGSYMEAGKVRYLYQENQERSATRNHGIEQSQSPYVAFLDADDAWSPNKLEAQLGVLEKEPHTAMTYCDVMYIDEQGKPLHQTPPHQTDHDWHGGYIFNSLILGNFVGTPSAVVVRRHCIPAEGFDLTLRQGEDWHLWLKIAAYHPVVRVPEALCKFRVYAGNYAERVHNRNGQTAHLQILDDLYERLNREQFTQSLYTKAVSRALFEGALIDLAVHHPEEARRRLTEAYAHERDFFAADGPWREKLISFAEMLDQTGTPLAQTQAFIETFFENIPDTLDGCLPVRNQLMSNIFASRIFKSHHRHFDDYSISTFIQAARYNPAWLLNRGFLSLGLKQIFGYV